MEAFESAVLSRSGGRENNQDRSQSYLVGASGCWVVADGLGGHQGGEVASEIAVQKVVEVFRHRSSCEPQTILRGLQEAQRSILQRQQEVTHLADMRTTAVSLISGPGGVLWGHIGDSRLIWFRRGRKIFQTTDHSLHQALHRASALRGRPLSSEEGRHQLTRSLGQIEASQPEVLDIVQPVAAGDAFLLCTDGFWETVSISEMEIDFAKSSTPQQWLDRLEERLLARQGGEGDNYTAMAVFCHSDLGQPGSVPLPAEAPQPMQDSKPAQSIPDDFRNHFKRLPVIAGSVGLLVAASLVAWLLGPALKSFPQALHRLLDGKPSEEAMIASIDPTQPSAAPSDSEVARETPLDAPSTLILEVNSEPSEEDRAPTLRRRTPSKASPPPAAPASRPATLSKSFDAKLPSGKSESKPDATLAAPVSSSSENGPETSDETTSSDGASPEGGSSEGEVTKGEVTEGEATEDQTAQETSAQETLNDHLADEPARDSAGEVPEDPAAVHSMLHPMEDPSRSPQRIEAQPQVNQQDGQAYVWIQMGREDSGFWIGQTEVTIEAFNRFTQIFQVHARHSTRTDLPYPVVDIDWITASNFCSWVKGTLPTPEQWSVAAADEPGVHLYPWGASHPDCATNRKNGAVYDGCSQPEGGPAPAKSYLPTRNHRLFHIVGNVAEWGKSPTDSDKAPILGGSWKSSRSALSLDAPTKRRKKDKTFETVGFRCVLNGDPES